MSAESVNHRVHGGARRTPRLNKSFLEAADSPVEHDRLVSRSPNGLRCRSLAITLVTVLTGPA